VSIDLSVESKVRGTMISRADFSSSTTPKLHKILRIAPVPTRPPRPCSRDAGLRYGVNWGVFAGGASTQRDREGYFSVFSNEVATSLNNLVVYRVRTLFAVRLYLMSIRIWSK
jgi:hypothetical protein